MQRLQRLSYLRTPFRLHVHEDIASTNKNFHIILQLPRNCPKHSSSTQPTEQDTTVEPLQETLMCTALTTSPK